jgi:hypothetical protein
MKRSMLKLILNERRIDEVGWRLRLRWGDV